MKKIFTILGLTAIATMNAQIVINEVYGGGGNSGATLKNDFVELINSGSSIVTLTGATLQYASATGTFNQYHTLPDITLNPGQTYLIQEAVGSGGTVDLPTPDYVSTTVINFNGNVNTSVGLAMQGSNVKIALVSNANQIVNPTDANVLDFVGTGSANQFEGSAVAPAMSSTNSVSRTNGVDTNNNAADFTAGAPTPKNSAGVTLAVGDVYSSKANLVKNTNVNNTVIFGAKANVQIVNVNGQVVKSAAVTDGTSLDVSSLAKGMYIVTGSVNGEKVSQKIIKN